MRNRKTLVKRLFVACTFVALSGICVGEMPANSYSNNLNDLLGLISSQVVGFLDQFSDVKCTEQVEQDKLGKDGKIERKEESTYDYLIILTSTGGELGLNESRLAVKEVRADRKNTPMLVSNGFATLFLVFHPYYADSFKFALAGEAVIDNRSIVKVSFEHIPGTRSPAALALQGKEYPLELSGVAWIDPQTGIITRIDAGIQNTLQDVGLKSLQSEVEFAPAPFRDMKPRYWFPAVATVEVETPRQHWRNTHRFTEYKRFSVSTEEQVTSK